MEDPRTFNNKTMKIDENSLRHGVTPPAHTAASGCLHSGLRGSFFSNFETELTFPDFAVGFVTFGVVLEV